eukprot:3817773-Rhodomonas_salina.1
MTTLSLSQPRYSPPIRASTRPNPSADPLTSDGKGHTAQGANALACLGLMGAQIGCSDAM